ncbi:MAG: alanine racemase [Pseudomonadota bacterium]
MAMSQELQQTFADADAAWEASTTGHLTIDLSAIAANWASLAARTAAECGAVVKANAYGCGLEPVCRALARAGCRSFFVATAREGHALRTALPDVTIYVLNGVFEDVARAREARLIPFLSSQEALSEWPLDAPFALHVDTGFNRLGVTPDEAKALSVPPALLASHFACADTPDHPLNAIQEETFAHVRSAWGDVRASFANSAALISRPSSHHELVRPGIALYGGASVEGAPPLRATVRLEARVIQVRTAKAGQTVGYGAAETLTRDSRVAILAFGYADGYLRAGGGQDGARGAPAYVGGTKTRLLGRVSMDLIAVDVTDAPCRRGDWVELFGNHVPLDDVAAHAGTIGYELLTGLSRRADRRYASL